jgi:hypothetical protein
VYTPPTQGSPAGNNQGAVSGPGDSGSKTGDGTSDGGPSGDHSGSHGGRDAGGGNTSSSWGKIFGNYLSAGKPGDCGTCHNEMSSASAGYAWLSGKGYINGMSSLLVDPNQSILSWYGGNMPPHGPTSLPDAKSDMDSWAAAGAENN